MESVWNYPRPPRVEPERRRVHIVHGGALVAESERALRVLETSHPPTIYVPRADFAPGALSESAGVRGTLCEWKGAARYVDVGGVPAAGWYYPAPVPAFEMLRDHVAVYASRMDECRLGGELVRSQDGDFYGGWITDDIRGPFKGGPGTLGW